MNRRPVSAYNLFVRDSYKKRDETKNIPTTSFNRLVGKLWADLPQEEKDKFAMQVGRPPKPANDGSPTFPQSALVALKFPSF